MRYRIVFRHPQRERAILVDTSPDERRSGVDHYAGQPLYDGGTITVEGAVWAVSRQEWADRSGEAFREYVCRCLAAAPETGATEGETLEETAMSAPA